jgi:putative ABC transport system permease protein
MPRTAEVTVDARVLAFTFAIAVVTGVLVGLVPALGATRPDLAQMLREGTRGGRARPGSHRTRRLLVASEIGLAVLLLTGAGLLIRSFAALSEVDPGFRAERVATFSLSLPDGKYGSPERLRGFVSDFTERLQRLPGARGAGAASTLPMSYGGFGLAFTIVGAEPVAPGNEPAAAFSNATPGYFATLAIPMRRGRDFTPADRAGAPGVAIVNEAFARRWFPGADALGRRIRLEMPDGPTEEIEIVGVVGDVREAGLARTQGPVLWMPYAQGPEFAARQLGVVVRAAGEPEQLAAAIKRELREADPELPLVNLTSLEERIAGTIAQPRFYTVLLGAFAAVALLLSAVGIYGVMAYAVALRTSEIGIRIALGASTRHVLGQVLREGMSVALAGVGLGAIAALWLTGMLDTLLFEVSATDPVTFVGVVALLLAVAALACWVPARRAARVDPLVAIKTE